MQVEDPSIYSYYTSDPSSVVGITGVNVNAAAFANLPDEMKRTYDAATDPLDPTATPKKTRYSSHGTTPSGSGLYSVGGQTAAGAGVGAASQTPSAAAGYAANGTGVYAAGYGMNGAAMAYNMGMYGNAAGVGYGYGQGVTAGAQANGLLAQAGGYGGLGLGVPQGMNGGAGQRAVSAYPTSTPQQYMSAAAGAYGGQHAYGQGVQSNGVHQPMYNQSAGLAHPGAAGQYAYGGSPMMSQGSFQSMGDMGMMGMQGGGSIGMGMGGYGGGGGRMGNNNMMGGGMAMGMGGMDQNLMPINQRTVYVGNLPADAAVDELLSQVRFGPLDNVKILPEKNCAFISFLSPDTAAAFHSDAVMRKVSLHGQDLKIGWGKPSAVSPAVLQAVQNRNATRNVYVGNLDETFTEQTLRDDLARFGPIDQVKIVRDKNIGFVHFLSIATAVKVVETLAQEPAWAARRVAFGKDRCAYVPKNQHQQQQHNQAAAAMAAQAAGFAAAASGYGMGMQGMNMGMGMGMGMQGVDPSLAGGNRTCYLGNIHPDTTTEEICNTIRGGILQQIKYMPDKHIAFVTFVDSNAALAFFHSASVQGIALHNRRLKIGWGKHSGPVSPGIAMVVQSGGSRNVYVGSIQDFELYTEEKLRADFSQFGDVELVNTLPEKNCAFVNFQSISSAIKAIEGIKSNDDYAGLKIAYGKDRCGNPPRSIGFGQGNYGSRNRHQNAMAAQNAAEQMMGVPSDGDYDGFEAGAGVGANGHPADGTKHDSSSEAPTDESSPPVVKTEGA